MFIYNDIYNLYKETGMRIEDDEELLKLKNIFEIFEILEKENDKEILDAKKICEKWDISRVEQVVDMLGLMGDASDNIPGIPGVGEKTAAKLLKEYDTLENVLANADKIKGSMGEKVRNGKESAIMSKKLATIITNVPGIQFHEEDFRLKERNVEALTNIFNELEFRTLGKRILGDAFVVANKQEGPTDLFGNAVNEKTKTSKKKEEA